MGVFYLILSSQINIGAIIFLALVGIVSIFKGIDFQIKKIIVEGNEIISKSLLKTKKISFNDINYAKESDDEKGYKILHLYNSENKKMLEVGEYLINSEKLEQVLKNKNIVRR